MKEQILERVREGVRRHEPVAHPGALTTSDVLAGGAVDAFAQRFTDAGGEVVRVESIAEARDWLRNFAGAFASAAVGAGVLQPLRPQLPDAAPHDADLGVSLARFAVAETGSLLLDSREGRSVHLLPPTHLVWVSEATVVASLGDAITRAWPDGGASLGIHSGPSKSADIGGNLVRGVHGPGRVVAVIVPKDVQTGTEQEARE